MGARTVVVVGNPKPASRTLDAARQLVVALSDAEPEAVYDLAVFGTSILDWGSAEVAAVVEDVTQADLVVFASPTYKAAYTGLLKVFLDRFGRHSLQGVAVPLMLGAGRDHALAPEHTLRPVLAEIGTVTTSGLFLLDDAYGADAYADWLPANRRLVQAFQRTSTLSEGAS